MFAEYGGDVKTTNETKSKARVLQKHTKGGIGVGVTASATTAAAPSAVSSPSKSGSDNIDIDKSTINQDTDLRNVEERLGAFRQECRRQLKALTYQQVLWYRREEDQIPTFTKAYGVLQNGSLYFYKDKDEYDCYKHDAKDEDTKPLKLIRFELETNMKAIEQQQIVYSSVRSSARQMIFGTSALTLKVL